MSCAVRNLITSLISLHLSFIALLYLHYLHPSNFASSHWHITTVLYFDPSHPDAWLYVRFAAQIAMFRICSLFSTIFFVSSPFIISTFKNVPILQTCLCKPGWRVIRHYPSRISGYAVSYTESSGSLILCWFFVCTHPLGNTERSNPRPTIQMWGKWTSYVSLSLLCIRCQFLASSLIFHLAMQHRRTIADLTRLWFISYVHSSSLSSFFPVSTEINWMCSTVMQSVIYFAPDCLVSIKFNRSCSHAVLW